MYLLNKYDHYVEYIVENTNGIIKIHKSYIAGFHGWLIDSKSTEVFDCVCSRVYLRKIFHIAAIWSAHSFVKFSSFFKFNGFPCIVQIYVVARIIVMLKKYLCSCTLLDISVGWANVYFLKIKTWYIHDFLEQSCSKLTPCFEFVWSVTFCF